MNRYVVWSIFAAGILQITVFGAELLKLSPFEQWKHSDGTTAEIVDRQMTVTRNPVLSPDQIPARRAECFALNIRYDKAEKKANRPVLVELGIAEYDAKGKELRRSFGYYTNPNRTEDHFATIREVCDARTAYVRVILRSTRGDGIRILNLEARKLDPSEREIYSFSANQNGWLRKVQFEENLAFGKPCKYFPTPDRPCSVKDPHDAYDLTDGKFAHPYDEAVDFYKGAVGWITSRRNIRILLDLQKSEPLDKALIRVYGGRIQNGIAYLPPVLEAWISKDGKNYHLASRLTKLKITEKDDADNKTLYWLPEIESQFFPAQYMHTFELDLNADARYVMIRAPQSVIFTTDELAVLKAKQKNAQWNAAYSSQAQPIMHTSLLVQTEYESLRVADNFFTPVWFRFDDRRAKKAGKFSMTIDVPEGMEFQPDKVSYPNGMRTFSHQEKKGNRVILHFKPAYSEDMFYKTTLSVPAMFGPFYFKANSKIPQDQRYAVITTFINGKAQMTSRSPITLWHIPKAAPLKNLRIMLYGNRSSCYWPGVHAFLKQINSPWIMLDEVYNDSEKVQKLAQDIHQGGSQVALALYSGTIMKARAIKDKKEREVMCVNDNSKDTISIRHMMCPSYRGKYYQEMLEKIALLVRRTNPDFVVLDEEAFMHDLGGRPMNCTRCQALREKMKMNWLDFYNWVQADFLAGMIETIRQNLQRKDAIVTSYAVSFQRKISTPVGRAYFNGTNYLFPKYVDLVVPSNYSINTKKIQAQTRGDFKIIKNPAKISRYIAMGSGAYRNEYYGRTGFHQLLEAFMNGCSLVCVYEIRNINVEDYIYIADVQNLLAPFDEFLMKAALDESVKPDNPAVACTVRTWKNQSLILLGNYGTRKPVSTSVQIGKATVKDLISGKRLSVSNGSVKLEVPANDICFLLVER